MTKEDNMKNLNLNKLDEKLANAAKVVLPEPGQPKTIIFFII